MQIRWKNIGTMMVAGEVDAVVHYIVNDNLVDAAPSICGIIRRRAAVRRSGRRGRALTTRRPGSIHQPRHGGQARARREASLGDPHLMKAFERAKRARQPPAPGPRRDHLATGLVPADPRGARAPGDRARHQGEPRDPGDCADYSLEQGLTPRRMKLEEIFAPSTMGQ